MKRIFDIFKKKLRKGKRGYIAIMLAVVIPVILMGTKYCIDLITLHNSQIEYGEAPQIKTCGKEAALAVAENWNPGISLNRQKISSQKVADMAYNNYRAYDPSTNLGSAIPGLDRKKQVGVDLNVGINPMRVQTEMRSASGHRIEYTTVEKKRVYRSFCHSGWNVVFNPHYNIYRLTDYLTSPKTDLGDATDLTETYDRYDEPTTINGKVVLNHADRYLNSKIWWLRTAKGYPNRGLFLNNISYGVNIMIGYLVGVNDTEGANSSSGVMDYMDKATGGVFSITSIDDNHKYSDGSYTYRTDPDDDHVKVSVSNDRIKVVADGDEGYAVPAECNVDIILGCPTNAAACNINNKDINSLDDEVGDNDTINVKTPLVETSATLGEPTSDIKATPIYQIEKSLRVFLKNFFHTKGVTVGLIPYSGKVSLSPFVATNYVTPNNTNLGWEGSYFNTWVFSQWQSNLSNGAQVLLQSMLYNSNGGQGQGLNTEYKWNTPLTGCPIMARCGDYTNNHNNKIRRGDIFSNVNPASDGKLNFFRVNLNPCRGGYASILDCKCKRECITYEPNPYYIIEPTADLEKVYEICHALGPFSDLHNVSNFLFIPITWANNLWQDWTRNPECEASDTEGGGRLSMPSKMANNRKKALILVINKPDYFEPDELTYVGFDNDASPIPISETDSIDFSVNYLDENSTMVFADKKKHTEIQKIQGQNRCLTFESTDNKVKYNSVTKYWETPDNGEEVECKLKVTHCQLVKIVVEPIFHQVADLSSEPANRAEKPIIQSLIYANNQFVAGSRKYGDIFASTDGDSWEYKGNAHNGSTYEVLLLNYNFGRYYSTTFSQGGVRYSTDLTHWTGMWSTFGNVRSSVDMLNKILHSNENSALIYTTDGWYTWHEMLLPSNVRPLKTLQNKNSTIRAIAYGYDRLVAVTPNGWVSVSDDEGWNWSAPNQGLSALGVSGDIHQMRFGDGYFVAISARAPADNANYTEDANYPSTSWSLSKDGLNWTTPEVILPNSRSRTIAHGNGSWVTVSYDRKVFKKQGKIKFTNLSNSSSNDIVQNNTEYTLNDRQTFYIEPLQIANNSNRSVNFTAKNLRFISAEFIAMKYQNEPITVSKDGDSFVINEEVPFVVLVKPSTPDAYIQYKNVNGADIKQRIAETQYITIDPRWFRYNAEYVHVGYVNIGSTNPPLSKCTRYKKQYRIPITPNSCTLSDNPQLGKVSDVIGITDGEKVLDGATSGVIHTSLFGDFTYNITSAPDETGVADVEGNKITCPVGSILHVKAVPTCSVTFYDENGIEDNVGIHTLTEPKEFVFSGADKAVFLKAGVQSSKGVNFSHNLSKYKVRYSLSNANIIGATLINQHLRDYAGQYSRWQDGYKALILNNGKLAIRTARGGGPSGYSTWNTYTSDYVTHHHEFRDNCISLVSFSLNNYYSEYSTSNTPLIHSLRGLSGDIEFYLNYYKSGYAYWTTITATVSTDPYEYTSSIEGYNIIFQLIVKNGVNKSLLSTTLDTSGTYNTAITNNEGIALQRLSSALSEKIVAGDYICFQGDGELHVTVKPFTPTITFNCPYEDKVAHKLSKEYNFCIEPSQMTNDNNGKQSVTFSTTGNVAVTATYEKINMKTVTITSPTNDFNIKYAVAGHKPDLSWTEATTHPSSIQNNNIDYTKNNGCKSDYDGTTCYVATNSYIFASDDFGKNWYIKCSVPNDFVNTARNSFVCSDGTWYLVRNDALVAKSVDNGATWVTDSKLKTLANSNYFWSGFSASNDANNDEFLMVNCYGNVFCSTDKENWSKLFRFADATFADENAVMTNNNNDGWDTGCVYINGVWYTLSTRPTAHLAYGTTKLNDKGKYDWKNVKNSSGSEPLPTFFSTVTFAPFAFGSHTFMLAVNGGRLILSHNLKDFVQVSNHAFNEVQSLLYANGTFMIFSTGGSVYYSTCHDGMMWYQNTGNAWISLSSDSNHDIEIAEKTKDTTCTIHTSNMVLTKIKIVDYSTIVPPTITRTAVMYYDLPYFNTNTGANDLDNDLDYASVIFYGINNGYKSSDVSLASEFGNYWQWSDKFGLYTNKGTNGYFTHMIGQYSGDYFMLALSNNLSVKAKEFTKNEPDNTTPDSSNRYWRQYNAFGTTRLFTTYTDEAYDSTTLYSDWNNGQAGSVGLMLQGVTRPLNAMIWMGYYGSANHVGEFYLKDSQYDLSPTYAVSNVTKKALEILKSTYGDNLRVYVIKYRAQEKYKNKLDGSTVNFSYDYLTTNDNVYRVDSVSTQAELETKLTEIAGEIKLWAEYTAAKNVQ